MQYIAVIYLFFVSVRVYIIDDELRNPPPPTRVCVIIVRLRVRACVLIAYARVSLYACVLIVRLRLPLCDKKSPRGG